MSTEPEIYLDVFSDLFTPPFDSIDMFLKHGLS
jgi:hypothetical protein